MTTFGSVTEIVRGADLVEPTVANSVVSHQFGWTAPDYIHLPLAVNEQGDKLSKQSHAPARRWRSALFDRRVTISQQNANQRMAGSFHLTNC